jgi:hypothetical protein
VSKITPPPPQRADAQLVTAFTSYYFTGINKALTPVSVLKNTHRFADFYEKARRFFCEGTQIFLRAHADFSAKARRFLRKGVWAKIYKKTILKSIN